LEIDCSADRAKGVLELIRNYWERLKSDSDHEIETGVEVGSIETAIYAVQREIENIKKQVDILEGRAQS